MIKAIVLTVLIITGLAIILLVVISAIYSKADQADDLNMYQKYNYPQEDAEHIYH